MQLVPSIDLFQGAVVRLHQGDYAKVTRYDVDPVAHAAKLRGRVSRLHVVDLEGARSGLPTQLEAIATITAAFGEGVQVGGGIRSEETAARLFDVGVSRVVLGTSAVKNPELVTGIASRFPGRVILAVDARDGLVSVDGWTAGTQLRGADVSRRFDGVPIDCLLFTDVSRDGTRSGPAIESTLALAQESGRPVLASGGVGTTEHLRALREASERNGGQPFGVIVGRALYDGSIDIEDALDALNVPAPPRATAR